MPWERRSPNSFEMIDGAIRQTVSSSQCFLSADLHWQEVGGEFRHDATAGLNITEHQRASNLDNLSHHFGLHQTISMKNPLMLLVSVLNEEENTFITGFEVVYKHKPNEIFGYRIPGKQTMIDLQERQLCALDIYFGSDGIQAVLPLFETQTCEPECKWIGVAGSTCRKKRLELNGAIRVMRGEFDVSIPIIPNG